jgi:hypothetical protein
MLFVSDRDVYDSCPVDWLWIFDKLIIARKQGILAAPAGIPVPRSAEYIIRPITNIRMMGRGARRMWIQAGDDEPVPDGFFWSEVLNGAHISVDYHWGEQALAVEGHRDDPNRLDRFSSWSKVDIDLPLPAILHGLEDHQEWINVEYIGDRVIEVHLRHNDDFANHDADEIWPVWPESDKTPRLDCNWYPSASGDRIGFWIKGNLDD